MYYVLSIMAYENFRRYSWIVSFQMWRQPYHWDRPYAVTPGVELWLWSHVQHYCTHRNTCYSI